MWIFVFLFKTQDIFSFSFFFSVSYPTLCSFFYWNVEICFPFHQLDFSFHSQEVLLIKGRIVAGYNIYTDSSTLCIIELSLKPPLLAMLLVFLLLFKLSLRKKWCSEKLVSDFFCYGDNFYWFLLLDSQLPSLLKKL